MKTERFKGAGLTALAGAIALTLSACSSGPQGDGANGGSTTGDSAASGSDAGGTINGSGASSQANAQQAWRDNFSSVESGITVNYEATGSGTGREQFLGGQVQFAASDAALSADELEQAQNVCGEVVELPVYISPIAVAYNLPGVDELNLSADSVAGIFAGDITNWSDPAIAADNPDADLPDLDIIPVNRADKSGTTENFTAYLAEAAPDVWTEEPGEVWPSTGTQSAEKTSGVVQLAQSVEGSVTYADASQIGDLKHANIEVGGDFLEYSPEAAAAIVDNSAPAEDATDTIISYDLVRDGSVEDAYPIVMVSYLIGCQTYDDPAVAENVKAYFTYVASAEGQEVATKAGGGNAPISDELRDEVQAAIDTIE
ncbi:MAG: phosphate ABC transporter substrate-binding protein PstS [Ancrocorticia populi]|uniref:phosphate ABC transporter substrate-binding protein PstS n=1 Tax=Ancrocorticia populi TaxID=2175228 RepID=UPI003F93314C